jgi:hypothetical protein
MGFVRQLRTYNRPLATTQLNFTKSYTNRKNQPSLTAGGPTRTGRNHPNRCAIEWKIQANSVFHRHNGFVCPVYARPALRRHMHKSA